MDTVLVSFVIILPLLIYSWRQARSKQYASHRFWQITIFSLLVVAVGLFEADMVMAGGIFVLTEMSRYSGETAFNALIYTHTIIAILAALLWIVLVILSVRKFGNPPRPNQFSATHRVLGRTGMVLMMLAGITAVPVYYYGFVL